MDKGSMTSSDAGRQERRKSKRYPGTTMQIVVAPYAKPPIPPENTFQSARCCNISTGGLAFLWPRVPDFSQVVIGMGAPPNRILMICRVIHHQPIPENQECLVGCEFVKRVIL